MIIPVRMPRVTTVSSGLRVTVAGGGLAGCEAAWRLAGEGFPVDLYEMRPTRYSPAHRTDGLAELVCSNSLGADGESSPAGILKEELRAMDSIVLRCADLTRVPAGKALAVDRDGFARAVTREMESHPSIRLIREEVTVLPEGPCIVATGPLMSGPLAFEVKNLVGEDYLSFFDAAAPIVTLASVDENKSYRAGRWGVGDDYINCPLNREEYEAFHRELIASERAPVSEIDEEGKPAVSSAGKWRYFEGCLPIEVMAGRGVDTLRFGPMRPVGLPDPSSGREPYAVVQLRRDNAEGTLYNMVGFQTNLKWGEQERVFRMIPALRDAEFVRLGVMHRNAFVCAPKVLDPFMRILRGNSPAREDLFLAGQITGVEGYMESAASGLAVAVFMAAFLRGAKPAEMPVFPRETAIGSLLHYLNTADIDSFQPMNVNLGIFPPLEQAPGKRRKVPKAERATRYAERSREAMASFLSAPGKFSKDC